jgi:hypothetical protein
MMSFEGCGATGCDHAPNKGRRAWCSSCTDWCYPDAPCVRGELELGTARLIRIHTVLSNGQQADVGDEWDHETFKLGWDNCAAAIRRAIADPAGQWPTR